MIQTISARGKHYNYKGLKIYPVKIKDVEGFHWAIECLAISKNSSSDVKILRMTFLEFLMNVMIESVDFRTKFELLCEIVFKTEKFRFEQDQYNQWQLIIDDINVITADDLEQIKIIIAEQNLLDLSDEIMNPEVRKKLNETRQFLSKQSEGKVAKFDEQIIAYHCASGKSYEEIDELTFYQFQKGLSRFNHMFNSQVILTGMYSGIYGGTVDGSKLKETINWLDHIPDKVKDSDIKLNPEEFKKKSIQQGIVG